MIIQCEIFSRCIHISNHHNTHFKYATILFVNYISVKLENKKDQANHGEEHQGKSEIRCMQPTVPCPASSAPSANMPEGQSP